MANNNINDTKPEFFNWNHYKKLEKAAENDNNSNITTVQLTRMQSSPNDYSYPRRDGHCLIKAEHDLLVQILKLLATKNNDDPIIKTFDTVVSENYKKYYPNKKNKLTSDIQQLTIPTILNTIYTKLYNHSTTWESLGPPSASAATLFPGTEQRGLDGDIWEITATTIAFNKQYEKPFKTFEELKVYEKPFSKLKLVNWKNARWKKKLCQEFKVCLFSNNNNSFKKNSNECLLASEYKFLMMILKYLMSNDKDVIHTEFLKDSDITNTISKIQMMMSSNKQSPSKELTFQKILEKIYYAIYQDSKMYGGVKKKKSKKKTKPKKTKTKSKSKTKSKTKSKKKPKSKKTKKKSKKKSKKR